MIRMLRKSWWLLALGGLLEMMYSAMNFLTERVDGSFALRTSVTHRNTAVSMGALALAAGLCMAAASVWSSRKRYAWLLLLLNGFSGAGLGAILVFWRGPLSFRTIALLIFVMAVSIGAYELACAQEMRRLEGWLFSVSGVVSLGFSLVFVAFVLRWMSLQRDASAAGFYWIGSYFAFSAVCTVALAVRLYGFRCDSPHLLAAH